MCLNRKSLGYLSNWILLLNYPTPVRVGVGKEVSILYGHRCGGLGLSRDKFTITTWPPDDVPSWPREFLFYDNSLKCWKFRVYPVSIFYMKWTPLLRIKRPNLRPGFLIFDETSRRKMRQVLNWTVGFRAKIPHPTPFATPGPTWRRHSDHWWGDIQELSLSFDS